MTATKRAATASLDAYLSRPAKRQRCADAARAVEEDEEGLVGEATESGEGGSPPQPSRAPPAQRRRHITILDSPVHDSRLCDGSPPDEEAHEARSELVSSEEEQPRAKRARNKRETRAADWFNETAGASAYLFEAGDGTVPDANELGAEEVAELEAAHGDKRRREAFFSRPLFAYRNGTRVWKTREPYGEDGALAGHRLLFLKQKFFRSNGEVTHVVVKDARNRQRMLLDARYFGDWCDAGAEQECARYHDAAAPSVVVVQ